MATLGEQVRKVEFERKLSQHEVARMAGVSPKTVQRVERDDPTVTKETKAAVARALGIPYDADKDVAPLRRGPSPGARRQPTQPSPPDPLYAIPEWTLDFRAGPWTYVDSKGELDYNDPAQRAVIQQGLFRCYIRGDSMKPDWLDGDRVEFRRLRQDAEWFRVNEDYYVQRADNAATFKRCVGLDDDAAMFQAANKKKYPEVLVVARQDIVCAGLALGVFVDRRKRDGRHGGGKL